MGWVLTLVSPLGNAASPQWVTLDWTLAETLIALEAPLSGVAQIDAYHAWVGEPRIPETVVDLGLRTQPNLELLADLAPDAIFISPMFSNLTARLSRIAPVEPLPLYQTDSDTWQEMQELTRKLGERVDRERQAETLIAATKALFDRLKDRTPTTAPLLMVQFMDERHVRVFGKNGLYHAVLEQLGIANAWQAPTNAWGFSLAGIDALAAYPDAQLVVIEPLPIGVEAALANSGLWQHLPSVREGRVITLPPVWSFGALPSAQRFARTLVSALEAPHDD
ncbi:iron-siderophore ABC transporter substrate-binding protein [Vreelandella andesensis]|uniref:Iron-siderophore ABC transporter substrate-binding protein n=1 Tax=Vreelandella andesensis TaxID=447567 RepID=A0A3S0YHT8_9GAMM|nr:ABC transporter substrate-binding protein [Halomonas andesensis]RUR30448.1 iron-siderophore ABC transporter substrate-binding protein [Halomonas andesensis]